MHKDENFRVRLRHKAKGKTDYVIERRGAKVGEVLDSFETEEQADFIASFCSALYEGSYSRHARNAAKAAWIERQGESKLRKIENGHT